jgi:hypothetical protein
MKLEKLLCLKYFGRIVRENSNRFSTMKLEEDDDGDEEEEEEADDGDGDGSDGNNEASSSPIQLQQITQSVRGSSIIS